MNSQPEQDIDRRLEKLEAELNSPPSPTSIYQPKETQNLPVEDGQSVQSSLNQLINWFNSLPGFGKLIASGVGIILGFAILRTLLNLVASLIGLGFLALIVYFLYQFLLGRDSEIKK